MDLLVTACFNSAYDLSWGSSRTTLLSWSLRVRSDKGAAIAAKLGMNG